MVQVECKPYLALIAEDVGMPLTPDIRAKTITAIHPICVLADKLDAVTWRSDLLSKSQSTTPQQYDRLTKDLERRVRDHYDIYMLIQWLQKQEMFTQERIVSAIEHMRKTADSFAVATRRPSKRPRHQRPTAGYSSLEIWHEGTDVYKALERSYMSTMDAMVYGELPTYQQIAQFIQSVGDEL